MKIFTEKRLSVCAMAILFVDFLVFALATFDAYERFVQSGEPFAGHDFLVFYGGGLLAHTADVTQIYDVNALSRVIHSSFPTIEYQWGWFYPPLYLPLCDALSRLPYIASYLVWVFCTGGLFLWSIKPFISRSVQFWLILAAPAFWYNIFSGQNAFLTGALIAIFFRAYRNNRASAGVPLGLLAIKPHLGLLFPIFLIINRRWKAFGVALITCVALIAVSIALYGVEIWKAFLTENVENLSHYLSSGWLPWQKMASPYVFALSLGAPSSIAQVVQIIFCVGTVFLMVSFVVRGVPKDMVFAFAMVAAVPFSPHNFMYDWVLFILPILILIQVVGAERIRSWEWLVIASVYVVPYFRAIPYSANVSLGFLPVMGLYLSFAIRSHAMMRHGKHSGSTSPTSN